MSEPASDSARIGPYRLIACIGSGGMGEVWEGWDERLDRPVALKRIRLDVAGDPVRRERFRREARALARLSHPAVVQVFDIVESGESGGEDWIVMERVEGRTLAELLRDGPVEMEWVLSLAREIAEGLAEAHAKGILHRDLKTENVLVTPSGRLKIVDFGLAKRFWPAAGEESLSAIGAVVGTSRSMSPEQARGLDLDPRSDLFAFGVLLYEAVTGTSPFLGSTPVDTLTRICAHRQVPAAQANPQVFAELSALIDQLLEKERDRRPRTAREVAERLATLDVAAPPSGPLLEAPTLESLPVTAAQPLPRPAPAIAAPSGRSGSSEAFHLPRRRTAVLVLAAALAALAAVTTMVVMRPEPLYVAVARPEVGLGQGSEDVMLAAAGVQASVLRSLAMLRGVAALAPGAQEAAYPPRALARSMAADEVVEARLDCGASLCRVTLRRLLGADGRLLWTESLEAPKDDLAVLDTAVAAALRRGYPDRRARSGAAAPEVSSEDFAEYLRLSNQVKEQGGSLETLLAAAERLRQRAPRFLEAYLLEAEAASFRFFASRDAADLERAFDRIREARSLAPDDPRPLGILINVALRGDRPDEAEEALEALERLTPGDASLLRHRALLLERRGEGAEAVATLQSAVGLRPSRGNLFDLANLQIRQGDTAAARQTLGGMLERHPGDVQSMSLLAQLELMSGSPDEAVRLYEELVRRSPRIAELSNLGLAQLLAGRYDAAAGSFRQAFQLAPSSSAVALNLADAEFLRGRRQEAEALYRQTLDLVAADPAAASWSTLTIQAQAFAHLGLRREAVAAIMKALQEAPDNPQVAYEASLVYTLVGDTSSALFNFERAVAGGFDRRWFTAPWFNPLRRQPGFPAAGP